MSLDPRTPLLVGAGQVNQRTEQPDTEPVDLMTQAAREAADPRVLEAVDSIRVVNLLSWRYRDPGLLVGQRIGAADARTQYTGNGGNTPQSLVNQTCLDIRQGRADVVLLTGGETWRTRMRLRAKGIRPDWSRQGESVPVPPGAGTDVPMVWPADQRIGLDRPSFVYPLFEEALRIARGESIEDHRRRVGDLWAQFSAVAAANPNAWVRDALTGEQITQPGPDNRMISWPYPKLMNSNNMVNQAAALVLCSLEKAEYLQIPRDRWVFPHAGTDSHDTYNFADRDELHRSPAIRIGGARVLELAGIGLDDVGGAGGRPRTGSAGGRPGPPAHRHRWPHLRRRPLEQLRDALDRNDVATPSGEPRFPRLDHRKRRLPDQAQFRRLQHHSASRGVPLGGCPGRRWWSGRASAPWSPGPPPMTGMASRRRHS
jgi:acetyl-CoA C-acetyltransferase